MTLEISPSVEFFSGNPKMVDIAPGQLPGPISTFKIKSANRM